MSLKKDLLWNYISMLIMAASGLVMNAIIAFFYDSDTLGIFNEAYAWYMIMSQVSALGIHMAVLKMVPEQGRDEEKKSILKSALLLVGIASVLTVCVSEGVLIFLNGIAWKHSLQIALCGIGFFSLNKVLLNYLNARHMFVSHAVFQSIRYILMMISLITLAVLKVNPNGLSYTFVISETLLLIAISLYLYIDNDKKGKIEPLYLKQLFEFGVRILPSNMVIEMNTKVDVVCLGLLLSDTSKIGVYSFAILFAEGFYTVYVTVRKLINPGISEAKAKERLDDYIGKCKAVIKKYNIIGSALILFLVIAVYYATCYILGREEYLAGVVYIVLIGFAIAINNKAIIWGDILGQCGFPLDESKINFITVLSNVLMNTVFIILWGALGAAIATALTHFVFAISQKTLVKKRIGIDL